MKYTALFLFLISCSYTSGKIVIPENPFNIKEQYPLEKKELKSCEEVYKFIQILLVDREYLISEVKRVSSEGIILAKRINNEKIYDTKN